MVAVWWRIAWRNLWRHGRRTLITALALAFGFLAAVFMVGLTDGIIAEMIETGTAVVSGQVQVHDPGYLPDRPVYATIGGDSGADVASLVTRIEQVPGVVAAAPRLYGGGLLSAADQTQGAMLMGVDPAQDARVVQLLSAITDGRAPEPGTNQVAIGSDLANRLKVGPGAELVVVAPASDGSLGNDLFTVSGVFHTGSTGLDLTTAVVPIESLRRLLALEPGRVHEIVIRVTDPWAADSIAAALGARLGADPPLAVQSWTEYRPELAEYARLAGASNFVIVGIVFIMAIFGVANTMLMGTYERRREFAVVRALGSSPGGIVRTVLFEAAILGAISLLAGAAITVPLLAWLTRHPIDLSRLVGDFSMAGAVVRPVLRVDVDLAGPVTSAVALYLTALGAAVYPAIRASRVPPADALAGR
jgi:putative ABC transport system permease protein